MKIGRRLARLDTARAAFIIRPSHVMLWRWKVVNGERSSARPEDRPPIHHSPQRGLGLTLRILTCRPILAVLALAILALAGYAQDIVRLSQNIPGDSKPILLHADEISTWVEGHQRVLLLKGMVLVEHGLIQGRMQGAVGWVDQERTRRTGILHLDLYAEGDVHLEGDTEARTGSQAFIDLNTRGQLKLRSHEGKVIQQPRSDEPLYRRAVAQRSALGIPASTPVIQRTSAQAPASGAPSSQLPALTQPGSPGPPITPVQ